MIGDNDLNKLSPDLKIFHLGSVNKPATRKDIENLSYRLIVAQTIVDLMTEALELDQNAIQRLCWKRTPCNEALANHSSIQVGINNEVGLLGILNGIAGANGEGLGYIAADVAKDGETITGFRILESRIPKQE